MAKNFPNLRRNLDIHVHTVHAVPNSETFSKTHYNKTTEKQRALKAARAKKFVTYRESHLVFRFLSRNLTARKEWADVFDVRKDKSCQQSAGKEPNGRTLHSPCPTRTTRYHS